MFSDNYFDLPAGRSVTITCALPEGWTLETAGKRAQVQSLYNSFLRDAPRSLTVDMRPPDHQWIGLQHGSPL